MAERKHCVKHGNYFEWNEQSREFFCRRCEEERENIPTVDAYNRGWADGTEAAAWVVGSIPDKYFKTLRLMEEIRALRPEPIKIEEQ